MASTSPQTIDDSLHSVVGRARPIQQTELGVFDGRDGPRLPRAEFGPYTVREIEARTALTDFALDEGTYSLNPYMGCSHACAYCYVPDVAHVERSRWGGYVIVKRNLPTLLSRELRRREPKPVFMSSATDPYQPAEHDHRIARRCVRLLARAGWPLRVLTRGPLVTRDVDLFRGMPDVKVGLSVPTLDDAARRAVEPHAPPVRGRLWALERLSEAGIRTYANLAPAYPLTGELTPEDVAHAFAETGVGAVFAGTWRYLENVLPALRDRVDAGRFRQMVRWARDPAHALRMFERLEAAFADAGVEFRVMGRDGWTPSRGG